MISLQQGIGGEVELEFPNGRKLYAHNIITNGGLAALKTSTLSQLTTYLGLDNKWEEPTVDDSGLGIITQPPPEMTGFDPWNPDATGEYTPYLCSAVIGQPCPPPGGTRSDWADSWIQGWTLNAEVADSVTIAADFSYTELTRTKIVRGEAFASKAISYSQYGPGFAGSTGGDPAHLKGIFFTPSISRTGTTYNCPPPPLGQDNDPTVFHHVMGTLWNRARFRDGAGLPVIVDLTEVEALTVRYKVRVSSPIADVVQVVDFEGTPITCRTRAYVMNSIGRRSPILLGVWNTQALDTVCYESNVMPAFNANQTGSSAPATSQTATPVAGQFAMDYATEWSPSIANFATGIGSVIHHVPDGINPCLITTFTPKLTGKTTSKKFVFKTRYSWAAVTGSD